MVAGSLSIHSVRGSCMAHTTTAQCKPELACRLANTCTVNQVDKRGQQGVRSRRFLGCVANCWASKWRIQNQRNTRRVPSAERRLHCCRQPSNLDFPPGQGRRIQARLLRGTTARTLRSARWAHEDRRQPRGGATASLREMAQGHLLYVASADPLSQPVVQYSTS